MGLNDKWPGWVFGLRNTLVGLLIVAGGILYVALIVQSTQGKPLTGLEAASAALIGTVISAVLGVLLGIPLGKKTVNVASQLRRAHGIQQSLRLLASTVSEASKRMDKRLTDASRRSQPPSTELKMAADMWCEVAAYINAQVEAAMLESGRIIADWGDLAPVERDDIATGEAKRESAIEEFRSRLSEIKTVERGLASTGTGKRLHEVAQAIEEGIRNLRTAPPSSRLVEGYKQGTARELLNSGAYMAAVAAYDRIIETYPRIFTNYLQRARARALAGDLVGAESDLSVAERLAPPREDAAQQISRVRDFVLSTKSGIHGQPQRTRESDPQTGLDTQRLANSYLAQGKAADALKYFVRAEELGWNKVFSNFNIAMAECLSGELDRAEERLNRIVPTFASALAVNVEALRKLIAILRDDVSPIGLDSLSHALEEYRETNSDSFDFEKSPLRFFEAGLIALGKLSATSRAVFTLMRGTDTALVN